MLREIGGAGQAKLREAHVQVVGCGGLGGPAALYLAAAGVGRIGLFDPDVVEDSNLQRQIQFGEGEIGRPKVEVLAERLRAVDAKLDVWTVQKRVEEIGDLGLCDVVLDGTDNFETRFHVNAKTRLLQTPLVSGAVAGWQAQVGVFGGWGDAACYRCLVPEVPPEAMDCEATGIVGAVAGLAGSVMALEAIKLITGAGEPLVSRLWLHDGLAGEGRTVRVPRDPGCPECGRL